MKGFLRHWQQRWRMAELRLLLLALIISVTVVTSVGFFTSRVENAMQQQARQLLGGDVVLVSSRPLAADNLQRAQALGLETAQSISFSSMASSTDQSQLAQIKAVSSTYPLRGDLKTADAPEAAEILSTGQLPARGEIWAEARLFAELGVQPGASVQLGHSTFKLTRVLTQEPDRSVNLFQFAPEVLMNLDDLSATGLLSPASRASFSQLFAGKAAAVKQFQTALKPTLKPTERLRTLEDDLSSVQQTLQRASRFLTLAALLSVVLAGAAVALTSTSLMRRELPAVAVLKAMGMARRQVLFDHVFSLLLTALIAAIVGVALGFGLQFVLADWLSRFVGKTLPAPGWLPVLSGLFTAVGLLLGFALPQLLRLVNAAPMRILQGLSEQPRPSVRVAGKWASWGWLPRLRRSRRAVLLVAVFTTGLFSLLLLTTVRTDLLNRWQEALPSDAPDHFLINIQPAETAPLQQFFSSKGIKAELYPMIRGRLVEINGKPVVVDDYDNQKAKHLLEREFNLSSFATFPTSNALLQGKWFAGEHEGLSIEKGIGETLRFGMGDTLTFDIAGQRMTQAITSVREVRWDSMQPNFFVIAAPGSVENLPRTFITSVHLGEHKTLVTELIHQFPSVTAIDIGAIVGQIRSLVEQVSMAVQGIFVFTLIAGVVVLIAALQSQKAERRREIAILKSLGAGRAILRRRIWGEFLLLGGIAGVLAGILAVTAGNLLGYFLFDLDMHLNLLPVFVGGIAGSLLVGTAGYFNLRGLLDVLPMSLLKS
jgi:putative ABC transport system permease protein